MTSIHRRLTATLLATVLILAATAGAALYYFVRARLTAQFDQTLLADAKAIEGTLLWEESIRLEFNFDPADHPAFQAAEHPDYFCIRFGDGRVYEESASMNGHDFRVTDGVATEEPVIRDLQLPSGDRGRGVSFRFTPHPDADVALTPQQRADRPPAPAMNLEMATSRRDLDRTLWVLRSSLAVTALALSIGAGAAVALAVRHALRPLRQLAAEADAIDADSLGRHFAGDAAPRELRPIIQRLNQLLARLGSAFDRERRFTADVSHELRTPIAELRSMAEVALRWPADTQAEQLYADTLAIARHMENLVTTLLAIARHQAGKMKVASEMIHLETFLRETWRPFEAPAADRNLDVQWQVTPGVRIVSDPTLLRPLLANLFANAVAHNIDGGDIVIRVHRERGDARLEIANACEEFTEEDASHLAEPFWRKDKSRTDREHFGLGLTLVATYARTLGVAVRHRLASAHRFTASVEMNAVNADVISDAAASPAGIA